jgi:hypothetical protein
MRPALAFPLILALAFPGTAAAQGVLAGTVREDSTARPLAGVEVLLEGTDRRILTDAAGRFLLDGIPAGTRVALFRFVGYRAVRLRMQLAAGDTVRNDVTLVRQGVQQLDPLEVTAAPARPRGIGREALEERRRMGFGRFIDSTDLRRMEHRRVSDVLRGIPGLNLVRFSDCPPSQGCMVEERAASGRGETSMFRGGRDTYCWMTVYLDGAYLYRSGGIGKPPDFSRDIRVAALESIEIYRSASEAPPEFSGAVGGCGVIVLWSRRG